MYASNSFLSFNRRREKSLPRNGEGRLFYVTTDKKVSIITFPVGSRSFAHLLFIHQDKQVNQIAFQQFRIEHVIETFFQ